MKLLTNILFILTVSMSSITLATTTVSTNTAETPSHIHIAVQGMVCDFCARGIEKTFKKKNNIEAIDVDLNAKRVSIQLAANTDLSDTDITKMITANGISVEKIYRNTTLTEFSKLTNSDTNKTKKNMHGNHQHDHSHEKHDHAEHSH